jgi:hypothetical protein
LAGASLTTPLSSFQIDPREYGVTEQKTLLFPLMLPASVACKTALRSVCFLGGCFPYLHMEKRTRADNAPHAGFIAIGPIQQLRSPASGSARVFLDYCKQIFDAQASSMDGLQLKIYSW